MAVFAKMLTIYASIHNHTSIPTSYIVPSNSIDWPTNFHGARLGQSVSNIRCHYRQGSLSSDAIILLEAHHIIW